VTFQFPEIRWNPGAIIGVTVIAGASTVSVLGNCSKELPEATLDINGKTGCVVGNFKFFDVRQSLVTTVSGSQVQMNVVQTFDAIDSAKGIVDLSGIIWFPIQPLETINYLA
jgi:hypothetical protein